MDKKIEILPGIVVLNNDGKYYLKAKNGALYNVAQTEETKRVCDTGAICIFEIPKADKHITAFGKIIDVVGKSQDPIPEGEAIARSYGLLREPREEVMEEVHKISQFVSSEQIKGIADLRDIPFITIDPDSAKDFDDAVFACKNSDGTYTLKVAIANVAEYIKKDSELFKWAMEAGNSSYLGETCNPMLPEELSNGICSLNEGEDRLVFCTTCTMNSKGELSNYTLEPAVIRSRNRLTYKEADYLYFGENAKGDTKDHSGKKLNDKSNTLFSLGNLYDVAQILYKARMQRGAFDIDSKKLSFKLDENKTDVIGYEQDHAEEFTSVIEETAILFNEIWGEVAEKFNLPFYYRNHKSMDSDKIAELRGVLKPFGLKIPRPATSKAIQSIINEVKGKRIEEYVVSNILRSMQSAYYDTDNIGHAGLAIIPNNFRSQKHQAKEKQENRSDAIDSARLRYFKQTGRYNGFSFEGDINHQAYAQSTSPIRRGDDTCNQMQMLEFINTGEILFKKKELKKLADHLNFSERNAAAAEDIYDEMLAAKWASNNIGKVFRDCTVVDVLQNSAIVSSSDGFKMTLPYSALGEKSKYLKVGARIESVRIEKVSLYPSKILCTTNVMTKSKESEENIVM